MPHIHNFCHRRRRSCCCWCCCCSGCSLWMYLKIFAHFPFSSTIFLFMLHLMRLHLCFVSSNAIYVSYCIPYLKFYYCELCDYMLLLPRTWARAFTMLKLLITSMLDDGAIVRCRVLCTLLISCFIDVVTINSNQVVLIILSPRREKNCSNLELRLGLISPRNVNKFG